MTPLDANSVSLHQRGSGPPLVLLHCLGVDHHFWDFADDLARNFTLASYDLPGHGRSLLPSHAYTIEDLSAQLAELLGRHTIARAHVAGISLGGLIAQHLAASRPDMVDRLILIDTTPRTRRDAHRGRTRCGCPQRRRACARRRPSKNLVHGAIHCRKHRSRSLRRTTLEASSGEGYALACEALAAADLRAGTAKIAAPTLVICGDDDIPSFIDAARWLESNIKGARLEWIAKARHASVIERPLDAIALMRNFLAG